MVVARFLDFVKTIPVDVSLHKQRIDRLFHKGIFMMVILVAIITIMAMMFVPVFVCYSALRAPAATLR